MTETEIASILRQAHLRKWPVAIQKNVLHNDHLHSDVQAMVLGCKEDRIGLKLKDGRRKNCTMDQIRSIQFMNPIDWY